MDNSSVVQPSTLFSSKTFHHPKNETIPISSHSPFPWQPQTHSLLGRWICLFSMSHINGITPCVSFCITASHRASYSQGPSLILRVSAFSPFEAE